MEIASPVSWGSRPHLSCVETAGYGVFRPERLRSFQGCVRPAAARASPCTRSKPSSRQPSLMLLLLMTSCSSFGPLNVVQCRHCPVCVVNMSRTLNSPRTSALLESVDFWPIKQGLHRSLFRMTSSSKNTGFRDCARLPALLRTQLDELLRWMTANWQRFSSALG